MYLTILALPMLGALTAGLLGRKIGVTGAHIVTCTALVVSALLSIVAFYEVGLSGSPVVINLSSWIDSESMLVNWAFLFDSLTVSMLLPVLVVSSLVHIFSVDYMSADPHNQRFFSYLSMFTFFMLVLVAGDNYLVMFVGWEGIGVSSYLLVGFWFTRIQANKSAIKAMTVNRVGDMFLSVGFFALFWVFGNLDYSTVFSLAPFINESALTIIGLLLLLAAMGKSAQLGLHTWLPDAMEGPTPVSALIHAATLVTAGVYLLLRSSPVLEYAPTTLIVITWVGALTAFFAATTGLLQNDIKRVIAYSTCSQMGYLFMAVGLSQYNVALFHLVNHAFFKALLFLAAGGVLHSMQDQQDLRKLGGLINFLPFTYTAILVGSLSLMAFPFLTGFFSKDLILELAYGQYEFSGNAAYWLGTITAMITAFYSFRLISMTFLTYPNAPKRDYEHTHEQPLIVVIPYVILSLLAIFFGYLAKDLFVGPGSDFLSSALFIHPTHITLVEAEFALPLFYKLLPAVGSLFGAATALLLYHRLPDFTVSLTQNKVGYMLYSFFNGKYYFDVIYNNYIINGALKLGLTTSKVLDRGLIEKLGPFGLTNSMYNTSRNLSKLDSGVVTELALYIVTGLLVLTALVYSPLLELNLDLRLSLLFITIVVYLLNGNINGDINGKKILSYNVIQKYRVSLGVVGLGVLTPLSLLLEDTNVPFFFLSDDRSVPNTPSASNESTGIPSEAENSLDSNSRSNASASDQSNNTTQSKKDPLREGLRYRGEALLLSVVGAAAKAAMGPGATRAGVRSAVRSNAHITVGTRAVVGTVMGVKKRIGDTIQGPSDPSLPANPGVPSPGHSPTSSSFNRPSRLPEVSNTQVPHGHEMADNSFVHNINDNLVTDVFAPFFQPIRNLSDLNMFLISILDTIYLSLDKRINYFNSIENPVYEIFEYFNHMVGINPQKPNGPVDLLIIKHIELHKLLLACVYLLILLYILFILSLVFFLYKDNIVKWINQYSLSSNKVVQFILKFVVVRNKFLLFLWPALVRILLNSMLAALVFLINHPVA